MKVDKGFIPLKNLATMLGRPAKEVLEMAQDADAIYIDLDIFQDHLDSVINEEIKRLNGGKDDESN